MAFVLCFSFSFSLILSYSLCLAIHLSFFLLIQSIYLFIYLFSIVSLFFIRYSFDLFHVIIPCLMLPTANYPCICYWYILDNLELKMWFNTIAPEPMVTLYQRSVVKPGGKSGFLDVRIHVHANIKHTAMLIQAGKLLLILLNTTRSGKYFRQLGSPHINETDLDTLAYIHTLLFQIKWK